MTIGEPQDPADLLICGSCRRDFPLANIVNFVDHKKFNCSEFDSARDLLGCQSCPSTFDTPWSLLQHAQFVHEMKIYQEQRAHYIGRDFSTAGGTSEYSTSAEINEESSAVNLSTETSINYAGINFSVENSNKHANISAEENSADAEFCETERYMSLTNASGGATIEQKNRNISAAPLDTEILLSNPVAQYPTKYTCTNQAKSALDKQVQRCFEEKQTTQITVHKSTKENTNIPLHFQSVPARHESIIAHSLPFARVNEREYSHLATGVQDVYYKKLPDNTPVQNFPDTSVIRSRTGFSTEASLQLFPTIDVANSSATGYLERNLCQSLVAAVGTFTEPLLLSSRDRNVKEFSIVTSELSAAVSIVSTPSVGQLEICKTSGAYTVLASGSTDSSQRLVVSTSLNNIAVDNNSEQLLRDKSENLLIKKPHNSSFSRSSADVGEGKKMLVLRNNPNSNLNRTSKNEAVDTQAPTSLAEGSDYREAFDDNSSDIKMEESEIVRGSGQESVDSEVAQSCCETGQDDLIAGNVADEIDLPPGVDDVSDITVDAIAAEITEKVRCTDRACGTTPHTHRRLKRCCSSVVPKKRKHHIETKHRLVLAGSKFSNSILKYGTSSVTTAGSRSRRRVNIGSTADDGLTNIYIDVDDDCAVTLEPESGESLPNEAVASTGFCKQRSVIIEPGMTLSIPVSYSGRNVEGMAHPRFPSNRPASSASATSASDTDKWLLSTSSQSSVVSENIVRDSVSKSPTKKSTHDMNSLRIEGNFRKSLSDEHSADGSSITVAFSEPEYSVSEYHSNEARLHGGIESSDIYSMKQAESYHKNVMSDTEASTSTAVSDWESSAFEHIDGKMGFVWGGGLGENSGEGGAGSDEVMVGSDLHQKRRKYPTSRPFKCGECNDAFNQRIHLRKHQSKHTGVKPFKCDRCDYSTVERSHLKVHIRVHTGEKPYKCTVCEYATAQNSTLKIHLKRRHHLQTSPVTASATSSASADVAAGALCMDSHPAFESTESV